MSILSRLHPFIRLSLVLAPTCFCHSLSAQSTASSRSAEEEEVVVLSPFEVSSDSDLGYIASRASAATKTNTRMIELPHSIQVLNKEFITDVDAQSMADLIRFTANVSGGDPRGDDALQIRGFPISRFRNAVAFPTGNAFTFEEMAGIERVEVIRGASAVLYGTSAAGGLLNIVDKRPLSKQQSTLTLRVGDHGFYKGIVDSTGPLTKNDAMSVDYRLIGAYENSDSWRDFATRERFYLNGSLRFRFGENTSLIQRVEYQKDDLLENYAKPWVWFPAGATTQDQGTLLNLEDSFHRGDSKDFKRVERFNWESTLEHKLSDNWDLRATAVYSDFFAHRLEVFISNQSNDINVWPRFYQNIPDDQQQWVAEVNLLGNLELGPTKHQVLAGFSYLDNNRASENRRFNTDGPTFNVFAPIYGEYSLGSEVLSAKRITTNTTDSIGLFVQDQIQLFDDRLHIVLGLRRDELDQNVTSINLGTSTDQTDKKTSPRLAALWRVNPLWSVYASYNESFLPSPGTVSFQGEPFPTPTAEQMEIGAKFQSANGRITGSIAAFENRRKNLTTVDVINPGFSVATGEVKATGGEIQFAAFLTEQWQLVAAAGILEGKISEDNNPARVGQKFDNLPESSASLWTKFDFGQGALDGFSVGLGFVYENGRIARQGNIEIDMPDYTVFNALLSYRRDAHRFSLNIDNLFDKSHVLRASGARFWQMGDRRLFRFSYGLSF